MLKSGFVSMLHRILQMLQRGSLISEDDLQAVLQFDQPLLQLLRIYNRRLAGDPLQD
jgi:hypothetical protein